MAMEDIGEGMTKKLGPLPVWAWGVLIGGAFVIWYWVSQRDAGESALADAVEDGETGMVASPSGDFSTVPVMPQDEPIVDENTNLEWSIQALNAVTGTGVSLLTAQAAISKYLNGMTLTSAEQSILDRILAKIGPPPEGVDTPDIPAPPAPEKAVSNATVTTVSGAGTRKFGQSSVIYVKVRWKDKHGHVGNPTGKVTVVIDDVVRKSRAGLINGNYTFVTTGRKTQGSLKDKRWVVRAEYWPSGAAKGDRSGSNQHVITFR